MSSPTQSEKTLVGEPSSAVDISAKKAKHAVESGKDIEAALTSNGLGADDKAHDVLWVEFEEGEDPSRFGDAGDPFKWPRRRKWALTYLLCLFALFAPWAGASFAIGVPQMQDDLGTSHELAQLAEALYPLGFGLGPMFLAPISEEVGRTPVYVATLFLSFMLSLPTGLSPNIAGVCISRLLGGMAASTGSTMVGGSLADIWETHERGVPMSMFSLVSFAGIPLGVMANGYVVQEISPNGWRWIQYIQVIFGGVSFILIVLNLRESRGTVLLRRRARRLRRETGDQRYRARSEDAPSFLQLMRLSLLRPITFLATEPTVFTTSVWIAFVWGTIWAILSAVPYTYERVYGWDVGAQGLAFTGLLVGTFVGAAINYYVQERLYRRYFENYGPEARLLTALAGGLMLPIGQFIFAAAQGRGHWIGPQFGLAILMAGGYIIFLSVFNYLSDCYLIYASSALAGQSLLRNLFGFAFPLWIRQALDSSLGITWVCVLFGFVGLALSTIPFVFFFKGRAIRGRSRVATQLAKDMAAIQAQKHG